MHNDKNPALKVIKTGNHVMLRGWLASDSDHFERWWTKGEWLLFDAPWEKSAEDKIRDSEWFLQQLNAGDKSWLNGRAVIATLDNIPVGWVNRYSDRKNPHVWFVGAAICEDQYLGCGLGTEALQLWVDYLFATSNIHKIGADTWSFNPRAIRVIEKVGFVCEGRQRAMQHWQGEWLDLLNFGMLRSEWESNRGIAE